MPTRGGVLLKLLLERPASKPHCPSHARCVWLHQRDIATRELLRYRRSRTPCRQASWREPCLRGPDDCSDRILRSVVILRSVESLVWPEHPRPDSFQQKSRVVSDLPELWRRTIRWHDSTRPCRNAQ